MSKVNLQGRGPGHIVAASRTACLKFKRNSNRSTNLVAYTYIDLVRAHASTPYIDGRSGLAVACQTAMREVLGSNRGVRAVGSCVYRKNHCDLQPWARAVCTFPAVPRSTQPSTLRGTVNEYQLSG